MNQRTYSHLKNFPKGRSFDMRNKLFRAVKVAAVALLALLTLFTSAAFGRPVIPTVNFRNAVKYAAGNNPFAVVAGDFNGDGKLDLAVANFADNNGLDRGGRLQWRRQT